NANTILRYDGAGTPLPSAGNSGAIFVPAGSGGLNRPESETFGPDGNLYVANIGTNSVLRFDGKTGAPLPLGSNTGATFIPSGTGGLNSPNDIHFGPDGNLYISNFGGGNDSVLRYDGTTGAPKPSIDPGTGLPRSGATFIPPGSGGLNGANGFLTFGP